MQQGPVIFLGSCAKLGIKAEQKLSQSALSEALTSLHCYNALVSGVSYKFVVHLSVLFIIMFYIFK